MTQHNPPLPVRWPLFIALIVIGVALTFAAVWGYRIWKWQSWAKEYRAIQAVVRRWEDRRPRDAEPMAWRESRGLAQTAIANVCYSPEHVSIEEMRRLLKDVRAKDRGPITYETLDWLWRRLAKTGPSGKEYITRMRPLWDEARAWRRKKVDDPQDTSDG